MRDDREFCPEKTSPTAAEDPLGAIEREDHLKRTGRWNDPERDARSLRELNEFVATLTPLPKDAHWGLTWLLTAMALGMLAFCVYLAVTDWSLVGLILNLSLTGMFGVAAIYHWSDSLAVSRGTSCGYESGRHWTGWIVIAWAFASVPILFAIATVICGGVQLLTYFCGKN
jgi:hypothetical protein